MRQIKTLILGLMLIGAGQPLLAQEDIFKDYAEKNNDRSYCLYPSTLRMINIKKNPAFEEFASSFDKLLIYDLDSASVASKSFFKMMDKYRAAGFEEYMFVTGGGSEVLLLGKEKRTNELVGILGQDNGIFAFFLKGNVAWQKIPQIIQTLSEDDVLNILDMKIDNR